MTDDTQTDDDRCWCGTGRSGEHANGVDGHYPPDYCRLHDLFDCPYAHDPRRIS